MWIIFKGYLICYNIASVLWGFLVLFFGWEACGILATWSGIEPSLSASEGEVLTTRPTGKLPFFFKIFIFYSFALSFLRFPLNGYWYTWLNFICLLCSVNFSLFLFLPDSHRGNFCSPISMFSISFWGFLQFAVETVW